MPYRYITYIVVSRLEALTYFRLEKTTIVKIPRKAIVFSECSDLCYALWCLSGENEIHLSPSELKIEIKGSRAISILTSSGWEITIVKTMLATLPYAVIIAYNRRLEECFFNICNDENDANSKLKHMLLVEAEGKRPTKAKKILDEIEKIISLIKAFLADETKAMYREKEDISCT